MDAKLFLLQRLSALVLGPLVLIHLALILYAVRDGLTGAEILARTQGSVGWALFYSLFVIAAAVHAPIGVRNVLREWAGMRTSGANSVAVALGVLLLVLGMRAVYAVIGGAT